MQLIELTYVSMAIHPMSAKELEDILTVSKQNNAEKDITGMLLYRDRYFIQALEGEEHIVENLYKKISQDSRHNHILLVAKEEISDRMFSDWSMGFTNLENADDATIQHVESLDGFTDFLTKPVDANFFSKNPTRAKLLLGSFKEKVWW